MTLKRGGAATCTFRYEDSKPTTLIVNLDYVSVEKSGYLTIYCNGRQAGEVLVNPGAGQVQITLATTSGVEWVKSNVENKRMFESESVNTFEGWSATPSASGAG
jgi:hypothetical protein